MENETARVRILACVFFSVYVWKCHEGFVHFLHIVAKSPSLSKINGSILDEAKRKY